MYQTVTNTSPIFNQCILYILYTTYSKLLRHYLHTIRVQVKTTVKHQNIISNELQLSHLSSLLVHYADRPIPFNTFKDVVSYCLQYCYWSINTEINYSFLANGFPSINILTSFGHFRKYYTFRKLYRTRLHSKFNIKQTTILFLHIFIISTDLKYIFVSTYFVG